ncbi:MAG: outer membrane protein assembly factor BamD [Holosporales bacterium]|jgi:outer membrane protein assembly factor BamD|nr:outer membrane protein assembly factor BamD [Holosporales bacterium]
MKARYIFLGMLGVLTACEAPKTNSDRPLSVLYREAHNHFSQKEYRTAAAAFEEVERQHPYSIWATKSQIMSAFCYYMVRDYEFAQRTLEVFIQYHPTHRDVSYAYYLKGMCLFAQISSPDRDPKPARDAREAFLELSRRFPDSPYTKDALRKVQALSQLLASHEICVGQYYEKVGNFLAALERFRTVLFSYPDTPQSEEAAYRAIECYISLGLLPDARLMEEMLRKNTPTSLWMKKATRLLKTLHAAKP